MRDKETALQLKHVSLQQRAVERENGRGGAVLLLRNSMSLRLSQLSRWLQWRMGAPLIRNPLTKSCATGDKCTSKAKSMRSSPAERAFAYLSQVEWEVLAR